MKQHTSEIWQHSPLATQVQSNPVKEVEKTMSKSNFPTTSWEDLRGLSWTLSKTNDDLDYDEEMYR